MAKHNEIGKIGENIAKTFLMKHGFSVLEANFHTRFGEIDLIAEKDNVIHFVEVKTKNVSDFEHIDTLHIKPEDNFTKEKFKNVVISAEIYSSTRKTGQRWQIDLLCVYVVTKTRLGKVILIQNVHVE
jgi:putative endonuclease